LQVNGAKTKITNGAKSRRDRRVKTAVVTTNLIVILAAILGWTHSYAGGDAPVMRSVICFTSSPAFEGEAVVPGNGGACGTAKNNPTSWGISGCSSNLSIDNDGNVSVNASGAAAWTSNLTTAIVSCSPVITATNANGSSSATITVNIYADGLVNAPSGAAQFATLLNAYHARGAISGRDRANGFQPQWAVAGVDYAVGPPTGQSFIDPQTGSLPNGCSRGTNQIICTNTSAIVFDGWDFSLGGGWQLICHGSGGITITKSRFAIGSSGQPMLTSDLQCGPMTVTYSMFNGNGINDNLFQANIFYQGTGPFIIEYCLVENSFQDLLDLGGTTSMKAMIAYNVFTNAAQQLTAGHSDWLQLGGAAYTINNIYNTWYQTTNPRPPHGTQGIFMDAGNNKASLVGANEIGRNTIVTLAYAGVNYAVGPLPSKGTENTMTTHDNFADLTGVNNSFSKYRASSQNIFSNNFNMKTGSKIP
jgi:hypothetical protein